MLTVLRIVRGLTKRTLMLSLVLSLLTAGFGGLTDLLNALTAAERPYQVGKQNILFLGAWTHSQDVTTDGEHYYFSSRIGLVKTTLDGETEVAMNFNAIPKALRDNYGSAHIGGISYHDGKIYAAIEDSKVWQYPLVVIYDAQTLCYTGEYHILSAELQKNGLPWLAVDAERGYIYAAQRDHSPALIVYDLETCALIKTVPLSEPVHKIQGGEMYRGELYVATQDATQAVYKIHPVTGAVTKCFDQNLTKGSEAEGLTMLETPDGAVIHTLDLGQLFINAFFRHYALPEGLE